MVILFIDNISNNDPDLRDAIARVLFHNNGMISEFESYSALLLPVCSYTNHRASNSTINGHPQIYNVYFKYNHQIKTVVDIYCNTDKE